jgi:hypothetical protein
MIGFSVRCSASALWHKTEHHLYKLAEPSYLGAPQAAFAVGTPLMKPKFIIWKRPAQSDCHTK